MIRVCIFNKNAYGYDVTGWENKYSDNYDNLLIEDLFERIGYGDIVMYFDDVDSAEYWCDKNLFNFEMVNDLC